MFSLGSHGAVPEAETAGLTWLHPAQIRSKQSAGRFVLLRLGPIPQDISQHLHQGTVGWAALISPCAPSPEL